MFIGCSGIREKDHFGQFQMRGWELVTRPSQGERPSPSVPTMALDGEYGPSPAEWVRNQVAEYEASGGTRGNTLRDSGLPVIIVTMRGKESGNVRKVPLMKVEHDGEYALVASMGGAPKNPVWYANLVAAPDDVAIQDGPEPFAVSVREITGDEKAEWWERCVAAFPPYADYKAKTDRDIPVFLAAKVSG